MYSRWIERKGFAYTLLDFQKDDAGGIKNATLLVKGESYFILSGEGAYEDNGTIRTVKPGDVTWTPDGSGHGISNVEGKEDLVFMALIVNS